MSAPRVPVSDDRQPIFTRSEHDRSEERIEKPVNSRHSSAIRSIVEMKSQLEAFSAEVTCELAAIQSLLAVPPGDRRFEQRTETTSPEPAPHREIPKSRPAVASVEVSKPAGKSDCGNSDPRTTSDGKERASCPEPVPNDSSAAVARKDGDGEDRLAALKRRLAAKLQAEVTP